jgi:hypothetical protein
VQAIFEKGQQGSPAKITVSNGGIPKRGMNSEQYDKASAQWDKLLREIGRN